MSLKAPLVATLDVCDFPTLLVWLLFCKNITGGLKTPFPFEIDLVLKVINIFLRGFIRWKTTPWTSNCIVLEVQSEQFVCLETKIVLVQGDCPENLEEVEALKV